MSTMASKITGVAIVCLTACSGADQRKRQSSASPTFVWGIHRWPVNSPHKGPETRKMFPFNDVIMESWQDLKRKWDASNGHCTTSNLISVDCKKPWVSFQYPIRRLIVRSREVSKPRDWYFKLLYRFGIWQAHRQYDVPVKLQNDSTILNTNLPASRLC